MEGGVGFGAESMDGERVFIDVACKVERVSLDANGET